MIFQRRLTLTTGLLILGVLAGSGCSDSSSVSTNAPDTTKIDGLSPGDYRDKIDGTKPPRATKAKKRPAGAG